MNVLIMANYSTPNSGNFIASLLELAIIMRQQGNQVSFAFPDNQKGGYPWSKWLESEGFQVHLLDLSKGENELFQDLRELISRNQIDLIHSHFGCCRKLLMLKKHKLNGVKILFHDHMDYSPEKNIHVQRLLFLAVSLLLRLRGIGVISVMRRKSRAYCLLDSGHNWYIPNGLSMRRNVAESLSREAFRSQMGLTDQDILILFLGWDMYRKGLDIAIKAVAHMRKSNPHVQLGLVGLQGRKQEQLDWIQESTGIDPHCSWIRYLPSYEDMFACHRAADAYLSASRKEAFSYGLLEAISQNIPVVISDIEGTAWAMEYSKCTSYALEDPVACAEALEQALKSGSIDSNFTQITDKYHIDTWCQQVMDAYQKMLAI